MMKHTNSGVPEYVDELDNIDVIANDNASESDDHHESNELPEIKVQSMDNKNVVHNQHANIDHENYYLSKQKVDAPHVTKAKHYKKPLLPKVLIALLIILLLAVIALSFVLYHIDQELVNTKEKTDLMYEVLTKDGDVIFQLKEKTSGNNESLRSIQQDFIEDILLLTQKANKNNQSLRMMKKEYRDSVSTLNKSTITNEDDIVALVKDFKDNISRLGKNAVELNVTVQQLDMYIQFQERYKDKIGLPFEEVIKLTGKQNKVIKPLSHLILLCYQFEQFTKNYETKWGLKYSEVYRLTDQLDFEEKKPIPLLEKIDSIYNVFTQQYQQVWKITFNDVIRLTTKADIEEMTLLAWFQFKVNQEVPLLLQKIEHMYIQFNKSYVNKWNVTFNAVIGLTDKLNFEVNETVPILQTIDSWYFEGFQNIWGNGFSGYVQVMMSTPGIDREAILKKLKNIKSKGKILKFLPGIFEIKKGKLAVYGYVAIYHKKIWGTIKKDIGDDEANVICRTGQYQSGVYDDGKYCIGNMKRDSMKCWYNYINCQGDEASVSECKNFQGDPPWDHIKDVGIKCYF